jgi:hypothetical protein
MKWIILVILTAGCLSVSGCQFSEGQLKKIWEF